MREFIADDGRLGTVQPAVAAEPESVPDSGPVLAGTCTVVAAEPVAWIAGCQCCPSPELSDDEKTGKTRTQETGRRMGRHSPMDDRPRKKFPSSFGSYDVTLMVLVLSVLLADSPSLCKAAINC